MSFLDLFRSQRKNSASVAKERLQIIISHERKQQSGPDYLPALQKEIMAVIAKYVDVKQENIKLDIEQADDHAVLELNITIPDQVKEKTATA